jgi:hypothetical protein
VNKDESKQNLYFITLNLHREKHKELIEWIKSTAEQEEQSLSSLCIKLLKLHMKESKNGTDQEV